MYTLFDNTANSSYKIDCDNILLLLKDINVTSLLVCH